MNVVADAETDETGIQNSAPPAPAASSSTGAPARSGLGALIDIDRAAANALRIAYCSIGAEQLAPLVERLGKTLDS